ncbi:MAG: hypothetical protein AB1679_01830 [Actinomycetota bacterium]|jgi:hypothetical protein
MKIFAQDRKRLWALLPAVALMLFASAAWAGDNPGPVLPNTPAVPGAPSAPGTPDMSEGPLRYTDIPAVPKAPTAPSTPGIPFLRMNAPETPSLPSAPAIPGVPKAAETPWMPRY